MQKRGLGDYLLISAPKGRAPGPTKGCAMHGGRRASRCGTALHLQPIGRLSTPQLRASVLEATTL